MKMIMLDSTKTYSIPDIYLNIGHLLDHFMMLIFAKAAFDAGREFGLSYEEIIVYGTLGVVLFGAAAPLAGSSRRWQPSLSRTPLPTCRTQRGPFSRGRARLPPA